MKRKLLLTLILVGMVASAVGCSVLCPAPGEDPFAQYQCAVYREQGCAKFVVASGGELETRSGATLDIQGGTTTNIGVNLLFEGATADDYETTLAITDPTADRTITLPNNSGTVVIAPTAATNYGAVIAGVNTVAYTNVTNKTMFVIPANADIVDIMLIVTTAFNDTGTDLLNCGYTAETPNEYIANGVVSAVGVQRMGADATMPYAKVGDVGSSNVTVLCKYTGQNGNSSAGAATVQILYRID